jgi:prepilin-type N-terminal cleavage/methylation domain-containing protein
MIERYREIQRQKAAGEREDGFTLIELLIVIVVLGILAAVVVFALGSVTSSSAKSACQADAKTVETALAAYNANAGVYPTIPVGGINGGSGSTTLANTAGMSPYLRSWPTGSGHYFIGLGMTTVNAAPVASGEVDVAASTSSTPPAQGAAGWVNYDTETGSQGCNAVS